jgi:hypothetical protein
MNKSMRQSSDSIADKASSSMWEHTEGGSPAHHSAGLNGLVDQGLIGRIGFLESKRSGLKSLAAVMMVTYGGWLVLCLLALVFGVGLVYPELETRSFDLYWFFTGHFTTLGGGLLQGWYILVVCAIIFSAVWVAKRSWHKFIGELMEEGTAKDHSCFFEVCGLLFALRFITETIVFVMRELGASLPNPFGSAEDWEILFLSANASVWEEIVCRVLLIGLSLMIVGFALSRGGRHWKYLAGGEIHIGKIEVLIISISAAIFAFLHIETWGSWRVLDTGLAGLALGYVFLKYGLAASIMLHFSFNYMTAPLLVFHSGGMALLMTFGNFIWLSLGFVFAVYYSIRILEFAIERLPSHL